jgi:hypothetical protein
MAGLSATQMAELSKQLQAVIDQARALQEEIRQRTADDRRATRADRTGEPGLAAPKKPVRRKVR